MQRKSHKQTRPPRIHVPNNEKVVFTVDTRKFVGVVQRLSLTGGSAVISKGPIPHGRLAEMDLNSVFGKVTAEIEFLHTGADGVPLAQAFRFLDMDDVSSERFSAAAKQMESAGFADVEEKGSPLCHLASQTVSKLWDSIRRLAVMIASGGRSGAEN